MGWSGEPCGSSSASNFSAGCTMLVGCWVVGGSTTTDTCCGSCGVVTERRTCERCVVFCKGGPKNFDFLSCAMVFGTSGMDPGGGSVEFPAAAVESRVFEGAWAASST